MTIAHILQRIASRNCEACKYYSDLDAHASDGGAIVARCLSDQSEHRGKYRRAEAGCDWFSRGPSIDLPDVKRSA